MAARPKTILIAEDEPALRELMRAVLGTEYRYLEAETGNDALRLASDEHPDLVILDLMLPGKTGLDVLGALRSEASSSHTPVVVVTAWSHVAETVLTAGADRFVPKPFEPDELQAIVRELLSDQ